MAAIEQPGAPPRPEAVQVRRYRPDDEAAVLGLLAASMGWVPDDEHRRFFRWKHSENPFGPSPAWVAEADGEVVGLRVFLRWELVAPGSGRVVRAVRAVDTATHPDHQGRGIFRRLTMEGIRSLEDEGVDLVFNTPNERSRPGYLKMGWTTVGRLPVSARPSSLRSALRLVTARVPAEKWSLPCQAGLAAPRALADVEAVQRLLATLPPPRGLSTNRTPSQLAWRYGFDPLAYRAVTAGESAAEGLAIFRLRRRGTSVEAALCELLVPGGDRRTARHLVARVIDEARPDHVVAIGRPRPGLVPLPKQGPVLVERPVAAAGAITGTPWALGLGDVELM